MPNKHNVSYANTYVHREGRELMSKDINLELQKELIKVAAETGARVAIETVEMEKRKSFRVRRDRRLHNTKLLLRNYRMLAAHTEGAIYCNQVIDEDESAAEILDLMESASLSESFYVESIKRSAERTRIIMDHIQEMLRLYEIYCASSSRPEDQRRFRVLNDLYISEHPQSAREIAQQEGIDTRTVYKDIDSAVERLSALLFGIDGLRSST